MLEGTSRISLVLSEIENEGILPLGVLELIQKNTQEMGLELVAVLGRFIGLEKQDVIIGDILMKLRLVNDFPDHAANDDLLARNFVFEVSEDGFLREFQMFFAKGFEALKDSQVVLALRGKREVEQVIVPNAICIPEEYVVERVESLGVLGYDVAKRLLLCADDVGRQDNDDLSLIALSFFLLEEIPQKRNV